MACCLNGYQFYLFVIEEMIKSPRSIAATTDAGYDVCRQIIPCFFLQLFTYLLADDALKPGHHIGVWMRPYHAADNIMRICRVIDPVTHRFVGSVFQRFS